jgi:DNA-binding response OmpR family regulator
MLFRPILLVDSDPYTAGTLTRTLGALGYYVELAPNGEAALRLASRMQFAVAIFNETLSDGEGVTFFEKIRAVQRSIRGVLLTAAGDLYTVWRALAVGMQRVLVRPVDFGELLPVVESTRVEVEAKSSPAERPAAPAFNEESIADLSPEDIHGKLSTADLVKIIRGVNYPFAGKERLEHFDRDTLERVTHLVRRWCRTRQGLHV